MFRVSFELCCGLGFKDLEIKGFGGVECHTDVCSSAKP